MLLVFSTRIAAPLVVILLSGLMTWTNVQATTYYVSVTDGNDANDGLSQSSPFQNIQHAANLTRPGDTVKILPGLYRRMGNDNGFDGVYITNSGLPDQYIHYLGVSDSQGRRPVIDSSALTAVTLQTKSYIIIENLDFQGAE